MPEEWREFRRNLANRLGITSRIDFGVPLGPSSSAARASLPASGRAALSGMPAYLTRPHIHIEDGGRRKAVALERHAALERVAEERDAPGALRRLRELGVQWYVVAGGEGPRWDPQRREAAFVAGAVAVYASR